MCCLQVGVLLFFGSKIPNSLFHVPIGWFPAYLVFHIGDPLLNFKTDFLALVAGGGARG